MKQKRSIHPLKTSYEEAQTSRRRHRIRCSYLFHQLYLSVMEATEIKYQTSFEDCQKTIVGICSCCGGELKPIETVDNSGRPTWWAGCEPCNRFDAGVSHEVYAIAKYMVDESGHISYPHMSRPKQGEAGYADYYRKSQICGAASLVVKIFRIQKQLAEKATT